MKNTDFLLETWGRRDNRLDAARQREMRLHERLAAVEAEREAARNENTALRRVVDADIEVEDTNEAITQVANQGLPAPELAWQRLDAAYETRRNALAAYRAEWSR